MNLARHRINKRKKELRSRENGVSIKWGNGLPFKFVHLAALVGKQHDISSLFSSSFHSLSHSLHSASYSRNGLYSSVHKAQLQMPPDPLSLFIPGQSKTKIHVVNLASCDITSVGDCMMTIIRMGKNRLRLLLVLNYFSCKTLVSTLCDKLVYQHIKSQN